MGTSGQWVTAKQGKSCPCHRCRCCLMALEFLAAHDLLILYCLRVFAWYLKGHASDTEGECQMALKGLAIAETIRFCIYTPPGPHSHRVLISQSATININVAFFLGSLQLPCWASILCIQKQDGLCPITLGKLVCRK